jgi:hypothetical protein
MTHQMTYDKLFATSLTSEQHERTCNYWFTVTNGATAHTAFETRAGLDRWMSERGLTLENELPPVGTWGSVRVLYGYREVTHGEFVSDNPADSMSADDFYALRPVAATAVMSNGAYTLALITEEASGVRTVHTCNPNVRDRVIFDRRRTAELMR